MAWESGLAGGWSVSPYVDPNVIDWTFGFAAATNVPDAQTGAAVAQQDYFNFFVVTADIQISSFFNQFDREDGDGYIRVPTRIRRL